MFDQYAEMALNKRVAADTWLMGLRCPEIARSAGPGQFVMIRVRQGTDPLLRRPFSICATRDDLILVLYRVVGRGTGMMAGLGGQDRVWVLGPLGKGFSAAEEGRVSVLVAGGIGIAPLLFLAQTLEPGSFQFLAGFGSSGEIIAPEGVLGRHVAVSVSTDDGSRGHHGPVTDLLQAHLQGHGKPSVYTCGPKPMLKKVAEMSVEQGTPCEVSLEAAMACGLGACQGCAVKAAPTEARAYYQVCKDGPVFDAGAIEWGGL